MEYKETNKGIGLIREKEYISVEVITSNIVKVMMGKDERQHHTSYMIQQLPDKKINFTIKEDKKGDYLYLETESLGVRIYENGRVLFQETDGTCMLEQELFTCIQPDEQQGIKATFKVEEGAEFYGLGQHQKGQMGYRGEQVELKHLNSAIAMPFVLTNRKYGLLWDNNGKTIVDFAKEDHMNWVSQTGEEGCYYFIKGNTMDEIIEGYWMLTGPAPMIPKYALGFWQSKMRYMTQGELINVAKEYRERQYPMDIIVIDFYHWSEMGDFKFDRKFWPRPKEMFDQLRDMHINAMVSVWPDISKHSENFVPMDKKNYLITDEGGNTVVFDFFNGDEVALYDPFNEEGRQYLWEQVSNYYKQGAKIWWLDCCEPDDGLIDFKGQLEKGLLTIDGPLEDRMNAYPLMHAKGFYEGQRSIDPNQRVLILARSAFVGCQRYGVTAWSGDIGYDFEALRKQVAAGLNATMSGLPFWTTDIGGFYGGDPTDEAYKELYIRWFQYGVFSPLFRVHGARGASCHYDCDLGISRGHNELWSYGEELEAIMVEYDRFRYQLMPYIYSYAKETLTKGAPFMRALVLDFTWDEKVAKIADQYMFGKSLMVCPVLEAGQRSREVYLPKGAMWFCYWTNKVYKGGQTIVVKAPLNQIPLFVKGGAILPIGPAIQYAQEITSRPVQLHIYKGADSEFTLYEDDGETFNYEKGLYSSIKMIWSDEEERLVLEKEEGSYHKDLKRHFQIILQGEQLRSKDVIYTGEHIKVDLSERN